MLLLNKILVRFAVVAASACIPAFAGVNVPDWVRQAAAQPAGSYSPETKAVVLLDQTDYTVLAPGDYMEHSRWVVRILRPEGKELGELAVHIHKEESLRDLHAWSIDHSGHEYELKQKDFFERSFPSFVLYSDIRFLTAKAPAADVGSVIAFEFDAHRRAFVNQINQFFQEQVPVREVRVSLALPAGWECKDFWPRGSLVSATHSSANHWEWNARDLAGIEPEPMMPKRSALLGRLSIAYFAPGEPGNMGSWKALGFWYRNLTAGRRDPTPDIEQRVQQLIAGHDDFDSRLRLITAFLQSEIRYVAIEIGVGGYQPHAAGEIFRYRYGDCKDKATLLSSMLHLAGINSEYVLIDTDRGFVNPSVPSVWFDHAILAIEVPANQDASKYESSLVAQNGKRYIIFDPTDEYTPVGSLRSELQDSYALLVIDAGGELIQTPLLAPAWNRISRTGHFVLNTNGVLSGEVAENRSGDFAMYERERLHHADERERTEHFERWLGRSLQAFLLESVNFDQTDQIQQDLQIKYKITAQQYGQLRGPLMLVRPRVLGEKGDSVEHKLRHYPVQLRHTAHETDVYEIELPKEYKVDDIPDPVSIDVGFAKYQSRVEVEGSKLHYWREYVIRDLSVPPEKFGDWTRLQGTIGADETAAVVLKRVP